MHELFEEEAGPVKVSINCYNLNQLFRNVDIRKCFIDEYFAKVPFVVMSAMFQAISKRYDKDMDEGQESDSKDIQSMIKQHQAVNDPNKLLVKYAHRLFNKFRIAAGLYIGSTDDVGEALGTFRDD